MYWTQGFSACARQRPGSADGSGAGALISVDGAATHLRCSPGPDSTIVYNALAYTSPPLDPTVEHVVTVSIDPATTSAGVNNTLDLDRFIVVRRRPCLIS